MEGLPPSEFGIDRFLLPHIPGWAEALAVQIEAGQEAIGELDEPADPPEPEVLDALAAHVRLVMALRRFDVEPAPVRLFLELEQRYALDSAVSFLLHHAPFTTHDASHVALCLIREYGGDGPAVEWLAATGADHIARGYRNWLRAGTFAGDKYQAILRGSNESELTVLACRAVADGLRLAIEPATMDMLRDPPEA